MQETLLKVRCLSYLTVYCVLVALNGCSLNGLFRTKVSSFPDFSTIFEKRKIYYVLGNIDHDYQGFFQRILANRGSSIFFTIFLVLKLSLSLGWQTFSATLSHHQPIQSPWIIHIKLCVFLSTNC